jgi:hypothetical protein
VSGRGCARSAWQSVLVVLKAVVIIRLLALVLLRALRIAARADDQLGMLAAPGIAIWLAVQDDRRSPLPPPASMIMGCYSGKSLVPAHDHGETPAPGRGWSLTWWLEVLPGPL